MRRSRQSSLASDAGATDVQGGARHRILLCLPVLSVFREAASGEGRCFTTSIRPTHCWLGSCLCGPAYQTMWHQTGWIRRTPCGVCCLSGGAWRCHPQSGAGRKRLSLQMTTCSPARRAAGDVVTTCVHSGQLFSCQLRPCCRGLLDMKLREHSQRQAFMAGEHDGGDAKA